MKSSDMEFNRRVAEISSVVKQMQNLRDALDVLCESFLSRANDHDEDPMWHKFYSIQMCSYLITKRNLAVSAPEGDMVHDLIRDTWIDVKEYMDNSKFGPISNVEQWFKTIHIDFPVDPFDPECTFFDRSFNGSVYMLCQNDAKKTVKEKTV